MYATSFLCCVLAMLPEDQTPKTQIPEAIALEERTLRARRAIACGEVEYHVVRRFDSGRIDREYGCRSVFDGPRIRCDVDFTVAVLPHAGDAVNATVVRRGVFSEGGFFRYTKTHTQGVMNHVVYMQGANPLPPALFCLDKVDPRLIGVVPREPLGLHSASLESFLAISDRTDTSVERDRVGGLDTWRIEYERSDRSRVQMWIAPSQDHSIVRAVTVRECGGGSMLSRIECANRVYGNPAIWFPHRVCFERLVNGRLYYEVVITVQKAEFNQPVDEKAFRMAGMGIPAGTRVVDLSRPMQGPNMWDGRNVVPLRRHDPAGDLDAEGPNGAVLFRRLASSVALVLLAWVALFVRRRQCRAGKRHRKTTPARAPQRGTHLPPLHVDGHASVELVSLRG